MGFRSGTVVLVHQRLRQKYASEWLWGALNQEAAPTSSEMRFTSCERPLARPQQGTLKAAQPICTRLDQVTTLALS